MLVPEMVLVAVSLVTQEDVVPTPGANRSTQDPKLEKDARTSVDVEAATVMAVVHNSNHTKTRDARCQTPSPR